VKFVSLGGGVELVEVWEGHSGSTDTPREELEQIRLSHSGLNRRGNSWEKKEERSIIFCGCRP